MKVSAIDAFATVFSLALHGTVFFAKVDAPKALDEPPPLEIALVDPPEEEPIPEPEKEPETPHDEPAPKDETPPPPPVAPKIAPARSTPTTATTASEATANPSTNDAPKNDAPVDFFGSGDGEWSLGSGGSGGGSGRGQGPRGTASASIAAKTSVAPPSPPPMNVVRKAALQIDSGCRGFFPDGASEDNATVTIKVLVGKDGQLSDVTILSEKPPGQGFGAAARSCLKAARGVPALGVDGEVVTAPLTAIVRFSR